MIGFLGTGSYVPDRIVTNAELAARIPDCDAAWISRRTLIETRRYALPGQATSDLAAAAATAALTRAGVEAGDIDFLIVSTSTGDFPQPPTSYVVQELIGARNAACLDVNVVCAGFVYAFELARGLLLSRPGTRALVVAADVYSRILDFADRRTAVLFGDGAGAAVLGEVPGPYGILETDLVSMGEARELIHVAAGGSRTPASPATLASGGHFFRMDGRGVRDFVLDQVPPVLGKLLARAGAAPGEVDVFVPHQANGVLLGELAERCGLGSAHTHLTVSRYGNVGSASVPVALDDAVREGRLADGDLVLLAGFGGGMAIGASLMRWGAPV
ncbi:3-oxoacyl-ACP synthase III family protein [Symbioplanes lichenis]|uniref:3-oxoacyl-ACP synthase III family protein n=1 Tax=Symbioplanes lichenis TaxID=1629072 RepID=UPI0027391CD0|nr:beta-ketoacyl-ACP synthase 3 [Actinoplanes lichenis]